MRNIEGLHILTDRELVKPRSIIEMVKLVIGGDVSVIQLRDKEADDETMIRVGREMMRLTTGKIPLIVNDRVNVALAISAQGVHVGQKDMPTREVRRLIGQDMILGVSASTVEQALRAQNNGADYLGVGPVFPTPSKSDADSPIGLSGLAAIKTAVSIPVIAIGGININNAETVMQIADGLAVISAVWKASDPLQATQELSMIMNKYRK